MTRRSWKFWVLVIAAGFVIFNAVAFVLTVVFLDEKGIDITPPQSPAAREVQSLQDFLTGNLGIAAPKAPKSPVGHDRLFQMSEFNPELARFVGLEVGQTRNSANAKILAYFSENNVAMQRRFLSSGLTQVLVAQTELADDSVKAEQLLVIFKPLTSETAEVVDYGMRIKCHRGENKHSWQTTPCP